MPNLPTNFTISSKVITITNRAERIKKKEKCTQFFYIKCFYININLNTEKGENNMEDISISQFKKYVQTFINAAKIDDGNGVIETKNGELSKLLSNFGLEESQIGDLLIKSDNSANRTKNTNSAEQPSSKDIHKAFIEAYKKYDEMTTEQKKNVRMQTVEKEMANYEAMRDALDKLSLEPLYSSLTDLFNDNTIDERLITMLELCIY